MMKKTMIMPQEVEVWYLLPALRRELANIFLKDYAINQRRISKMLGITESAVSQYLKLKRAKDLDFDSNIQKEIKLAVDRFIQHNNFIQEFNYLINLIEKTQFICKIHRKHDEDLPETCQLCYTGT